MRRKLWVPLVAVSLAAVGIASASVARSSARQECTSGTRCDATIECREDGCLVQWTAPDGRTGEIELRCVDGQCSVVRCDPCCKDGCAAGNAGAAPAADATQASDRPSCCTGGPRCKSAEK